MATGYRVGYYAYMTVEGSDALTPIESIYEIEAAALYLLKYLRFKDRVVPKWAQMKYEQLIDRFFREHVNLVEQGKRVRLRSQGINDSWTTVRKGLSNHVRITTTMKRDDGKMIHIRKSSRPEMFLIPRPLTLTSGQEVLPSGDVPQ